MMQSLFVISGSASAPLWYNTGKYWLCENMLLTFFRTCTWLHSFLSPLQLRRVRHSAGWDAEAAGGSGGWEEDPQLSPAHGYPAETGPDSAPGRPGVRPRADPPGRQLRPGQDPQQGLQRHLQQPPRKSESHLLWLRPTRAQQCHAQWHCGRPRGLLQREVQDLLRLKRLRSAETEKNRLLCTEGRGARRPDPPCLSVKEPHSLA